MNYEYKSGKACEVRFGEPEAKKRLKQLLYVEMITVLCPQVPSTRRKIVKRYGINLTPLQL